MTLDENSIKKNAISEKLLFKVFFSFNFKPNYCLTRTIPVRLSWEKYQKNFLNSSSFLKWKFRWRRSWPLDCLTGDLFILVSFEIELSVVRKVKLITLLNCELLLSGEYSFAELYPIGKLFDYGRISSNWFSNWFLLV